MKKLSFNLGDKGLKGFAIEHVEKFSLVVVGLLSVYFMYQGATRESYQKGGPLQMKQKASVALNNVTSDHTSDPRYIDNETRKPAGGFLARVEVAAKPTESGSYQFGMFNPPVFPPKSKRRDPRLFAITDLEVIAFRAAVDELTEATDPFTNDPLATTGKKAVPVKKAETRPRTKKGGDILAGAVGGKKKKRRPPPVKAGEKMPEPEPPAVGVVSPKYKLKYIHGYRPENENAAADDSRGVTREFNVITGLLPYEKYMDEFDTVLGNSDGYDAARDLPNFLMLRVERAEVGADPKAPLEWTRLSNKSLKKRYDEVWAGITEEIADKKYLLYDDNKKQVNDDLAFPMPPAMLTSPDKLGLHSKIPRADFARLAAEERDMPAADAAQDGGEDVPDAAAGPMAPGRGRPGMGRPRGPAAPGRGAPMAGAPPVRVAPAEKIKVKMVRFYDFDTEPGKEYRYRMTVLVEDPNRPRAQDLAPMSQILDPAVLARLAPIEAKDAASGKRTFYRESPPSAPSASVRAPTHINFVMGSVGYFKKPTTITDPVTKVKTIVKLEELSGTLLASVWNRARATEAPGNADLPDEPDNRQVKRPAMFYGTMLNFVKDVNVLRPDTLQIHVIKHAPFRTNAYVVDLRPCEPLPIARTGNPGKLETASEILLVDHTGKLVIHNELDDAEEFHRLTFAGELNAPAAAPR